MASKIKITRLEKTEDYINREWGTVLAQRQYLLNSTDWTQMEDNDLTFESRVRWNWWRQQVRNVKRKNGISREDAEAQLKYLETTMPEREFISAKSVRQRKYQLDISNLDQAKIDATNIMKTLHSEWLITFLPENVNLIAAKYSELMQYLAGHRKKKNPSKIEDFVLLNQMKQIGDYSDAKLIAEVSNLQRTANETYSMIADHHNRFSKLIQSAKTTDEIIQIVKNMHGY